MIGSNDLYDISAAFTRIRAEIQYEQNINILQSIKKVLQIENSYESNQIRNAIAQIPDLNIEKWYYVYHQNIYVYDAILKNKNIIIILIIICDKLISALQLKNYDFACDLVDAVHCLPDIIAENKFTIPKSYWKSHIQYLRNKWDKDLLKNEQEISIN
jgi:hypothetical protein